MKFVFGWSPEDTPFRVIHSGPFWNATIQLNRDGDTMTVSSSAKHLDNPDANETDSPRIFLSDLAPAGPFSFSLANDFGTLFSGSGAVIHPGLGHPDEYTFIFDRSLFSPNTRITWIGAHIVPEPSAIALFGIGLAGIVGCRFLRGRHTAQATCQDKPG